MDIVKKYTVFEMSKGCHCYHKSSPSGSIPTRVNPGHVFDGIFFSTILTSVIKAVCF
jgi:hypothetical protein